MNLRSTKDTTAIQSKTHDGMPAADIATLALLCALMTAGKEALRFIPNVHPVALLILLAVILYGWRAMYAVVVFNIIEIVIWGLGIWTISYAYAWPLLVALAMPLRNGRSWLSFALLSGIFGLCFGALCAIPYIFLSGPQAAISFWIAGIPFDLIHGASNFVITLILLPPLYRAVRRKNT